MLGLGLSITNCAAVLINGADVIREILNILGKKGLVTDAAGGLLANSRTSTATVVDYQGVVHNCLANEIRYHGARRVDHADGVMYNAGVLGVEYLDTEIDGVTPLVPAPTILNEGTSTNLVPHSSDFDTTGTNWYLNNMSTPVSVNTHIAPDGTLTASTITFDGFAGSSLNQHLLLLAGTYAVSIWAKVDSGTKPFTLDIFDPATGHTETQVFTATTTWKRFEGVIVKTAPNGDIRIRNNGDAQAGQLVVWGIQVESRADVTSYIPTTAAPTSRSADNITLPFSIGNNFYQYKGILLFRFIPEYDSTIIESPLFSIFDGVSVLSSKLKSTDGTNSIDSLATYSKGDDVLASVTWSAAESLFSISYSLDGGVTWAAWVSGVYDGAFSSGLNINLFYTNAYVNKLKAAQVYYPDTSYNIASMQVWVESNGGSKT